MKRLLIVGLFLIGCSPQTEVVSVYKGAKGDKGDPGVSCSVSQTELGALLSCSDETSVIISNGSDGSNGTNGQDGTSCSVESTTGGALITCGDTSASILNGTDGVNGADGQDGSDGSDGGSLSVTDYSAVSCTSIAGTSYYVKKTGGNNFAIYTSSSCSSSSKEFEVSQGEAHVLGLKILAVWTESALRIFNFN